MTYILLPTVQGKPWLYLDCITQIAKPEPQLSFSLNHFLTEIKNKIQDHERDWDTYKKYTNPYEFIHGSRFFVCKYKPISRAYFKMLEILHTFNILMPFKHHNGGRSFNSKIVNSKTYKDATKQLICEANDEKELLETLKTTEPIVNSSDGWINTGKITHIKPIKMFGLAEGPGGFIEAACNYRNNNPADIYVGMSIEDSADSNVPGWSKIAAYMHQHPNIVLEKGADGTGNLLSLDNFRHVVATHRNSVDLVTGDGGFDFSSDFNNQEMNMLDLLFAQIAYAICIQKRGGSFVLKIFDCFHKATVELLYLVASFYEKVHIIKPNTSRYANSEKYLVCTGFKYNGCDEFYGVIERTMEKILSRKHEHFISGFMKGRSTPMIFNNKIEETNNIIGQTQIETIHNTLALIEMRGRNEKIDYYIRTHQQKCQHWCIKHGLE